MFIFLYLPSLLDFHFIADEQGWPDAKEDRAPVMLTVVQRRKFLQVPFYTITECIALFYGVLAATI